MLLNITGWPTWNTNLWVKWITTWSQFSTKCHLYIKKTVRSLFSLYEKNMQLKPTWFTLGLTKQVEKKATKNIRCFTILWYYSSDTISANQVGLHNNEGGWVEYAFGFKQDCKCSSLLGYWAEGHKSTEIHRLQRDGQCNGTQQG